MTAQLKICYAICMSDSGFHLGNIELSSSKGLVRPAALWGTWPG